MLGLPPEGNIFLHILLGGGFKYYIAFESRHQHGAIAKTGGFKYFFIFTPIWGNDPIWLILAILVTSIPGFSRDFLLIFFSPSIGKPEHHRLKSTVKYGIC